MYLTEIQLDIKTGTFTNIFNGVWFQASQLNAHDIILHKQIMLSMDELDIEFR